MELNVLRVELSEHACNLYHFLVPEILSVYLEQSLLSLRVQFEMRLVFRNQINVFGNRVSKAEEVQFLLLINSEELR